ncbi:MAG: MarR family transcriptional regulator [Chitinophagales bacterium]|nr:MarR family transcriptional regulator [Chitinophagales bacterium]
MNKEYYQTVYEIITTGHWITDEITKALKEHGVTEPQYNVLRILRGAKGEPVTVGDILDKMVQRSSNITRIVDKLVTKNYVNRKECPTNRRKMDITITEEGIDILKQLDKKVHAFHQPFINKLDKEELNTLKSLIQKLKS